jgi:hypothetical protein
MTGARLRLASNMPLMKMQTTGTAAAGDCRQPVRDLRLRLRGERSRLLVSHRHPLDFAFFE